MTNEELCQISHKLHFEFCQALMNCLPEFSGKILMQDFHKAFSSAIGGLFLEITQQVMVDEQSVKLAISELSSNLLDLLESKNKDKLKWH